MESRAQLNTAMMSFFGFDWLNQEAVTLTCKTCGRIEWFTDRWDSKPQPSPRVDVEEPVVEEVEPPKTTAQLPQEDPEFQKWQEDHPEVKKRLMIDQIALYRDFQQGRS